MLKSYSLACTALGHAPGGGAKPGLLLGGVAKTSFSCCNRPHLNQLRNYCSRGAWAKPITSANHLWRTAARYASSGTRDPYTVLGVSRSASQDEIKAAYKKLVLQYHPDQNKSPGAEDKFKEISAAYNMLRDQGKRREYDAGSAWGSSGPGSGGYGPSGGASAGYSTSSSSSSSNRGPDKYGNYQHHTVNREEADRIFKEMFGSRDFDSIFRDFYQQQQGPAGGQGNNPFGNTQGAKVTRDEFVRDAQGNTYRVTTWETTGGSSQQQERGRGRRREPANTATGYPGDDFFGADGPYHGLSGRGRNPINPFFSGPSTRSPFSNFFAQAANPWGQQTGNPFANQQQQQQGATSQNGSGNASPGAGGGGAGNGSSGPFGQDASHQGGAEGFRNENIGQHPFYWNQPPVYSFNPMRVFMWVFLLGALSTLVMGFFFSHPGLILLMAFFWILFRRPRM